MIATKLTRKKHSVSKMEEFNRTYQKVMQKKRLHDRNTKIFKEAQEMLVA
jgi:hypothetical protein